MSRVGRWVPTVKGSHPCLETLMFLFFALALPAPAVPPPPRYTEIPGTAWSQNRREAGSLDGEFLCTIAYPAGERAILAATTPANLGPGLYRLRLTLSPSDVTDTSIWTGGLRVIIDGQATTLPGYSFGRVHTPEVHTIDFIHHSDGPVRITLESFVEDDVFEMVKARRELKGPAGAVGPALKLGTSADDDGAGGESVMNAFRPLDPETHFYYLLHKAELAPLSRSGHVRDLQVNKVRYLPGETLRGECVVENSSRSDTTGKVLLYLESHLDRRVLVREIPVTLTAKSQTLTFDLPLPTEEYGHALAAEYVSSDGIDLSRAVAPFTISSSVFQVPIYMCRPGGLSLMPEAQMRAYVDELYRAYINCIEIFFWGVDDMVELSPEDDYWFSGQTCYHVSKKGMQNLIRLAHERGISMVTYGKFIMSGYEGWKTAYAYPNDHKQQYGFTMGMWEATRVKTLDRFFYKEFAGPNSPDPGDYMSVSWSDFMPINPDPSPRMVRIAAEEILRSTDMFGWDAVRWDGHPRGVGMYAGQIGGPGAYSYEVARKTQMFVRYFKDIVNEKYPSFGHGYNYLFAHDQPSHDWGIEDFELEELASQRGLLMNEHIKMASLGKSHEWFVRNIQVQGDLARERGGKLLLITGADRASPLDKLAQQILSFAGGACNYSVGDPRINRYATRFSRYCFDERARRIARPGDLLDPVKPVTNLWWQPYVFETPRQEGKSSLVVNLLNLPATGIVSPPVGSKPGDQELVPASDPVDFSFRLPDGYRMLSAHLVHPFTLDVVPIPLEGDRIHVPSIRLWAVLVLDLESRPDVATLDTSSGAPRTLPKLRDKVEVPRQPFLPFDIRKPVREVAADMARQFPRTAPSVFDETHGFAAMDWNTRNTAVLSLRGTNSAATPPPPPAPSMAPVRDGIMDVYYARGPMDYPLRMYDAFAALDRVGIEESVLYGAQTWYGLSPAFSWHRLPRTDLLVFADIPFPAIGAENATALVQYVRAGGAALFTGGEYSFGKGGYHATDLDHHLLPVICLPGVDTRYAPDPLPMEAGPDWNDLGVSADFSCKPVLWTWNQVALRENASVKVFLKSGNRPILVGWQLGAGRVACLLTTQRGQSDAIQGITAFFDWKDWPNVETALFRWLAPEAFRAAEKAAASATLTGEETDRLIQSLEDNAMEDLVTDDGDTDGSLIDDAGGPGGANETELSPADLQRLAYTLRRLTPVRDSRATAAMAYQLGRVANLSDSDRWALIDSIAACPPAALADVAGRCRQSLEPAIRGIAYQLFAIANDPRFKDCALSPGTHEAQDPQRTRYLALALCRYTRDDLKEHGIQRLAEWTRRETEARQRYTGGQDFSMAAPEVPLLDSNSLLERVGWLAYLARLDPAAWGAAFLREWSMADQYEDYCEREVQGIEMGMRYMVTQKDLKMAQDLIRRTRVFKAFFARLGQLGAPQAEALCRSHPEAAAEGFRQCTFLAQAQRYINVVGRLPNAAALPILEKAQQSRQPLLAAFAAKRLDVIRSTARKR